MEEKNRWDAFSLDELEKIDYAFWAAESESLQDVNDPLWEELKAEIEKRKGA